MSDVFEIITNKDSTVFDFWKKLLKLKNNFVGVTELKVDGLNILHMCIDKGRLSYLPAIVHIGWWHILANEKVSEFSSHEHKGKTAKQIAETKKAKKPLFEFNQTNEWDCSLSPLMKACRSGDTSRAQQIINIGGEDIYYTDFNGGNALYWAVVNGNESIVKSLVHSGIDPSVRTKKNENLLHIACMVGQANLITTLLKTPFVLDAWLRDNSQKTPLDRNAENGDIDTLKAFVTHGIVPKPESAPLSAFCGRGAYLEYLIDKLKMKIDSVDVYSRTALHRACEASKVRITRWLLNRGADIRLLTCTMRNLLHIIAESGNCEILGLVIALFKEHKILSEMINAQDRYIGVELCFLIRGRDKGRDAFHYVEVKRYLVSIFLEKTRSGNVDVATYGTVIKSGWGVNPEQDTITEIEQIFKDRRLSQSAPVDVTPLQIAIFKGHTVVATMLIEQGCNVNIKDSCGNSPLMLAASKGNLEILRLLEKKGANFEDVNEDGKSALDIADENEKPDVVNYIKGRGYDDLTKNFLEGKVSMLESKLSTDHLDDIRRNGGNVKRELVDILREFRIDINEFLVNIGSGPVLEASDNDPPQVEEIHRHQATPNTITNSVNYASSNVLLDRRTHKANPASSSTSQENISSGYGSYQADASSTQNLKEEGSRSHSSYSNDPSSFGHDTSSGYGSLAFSSTSESQTDATSGHHNQLDQHSPSATPTAH